MSPSLNWATLGRVILEDLGMRSGGSSSGKVVTSGATIRFDPLILERFDLTTVESSWNGLVVPAEDDPPFSVPLIIPLLRGLAYLAWLRSNEFRSGRDENFHLHHHRQCRRRISGGLQN